MNKSEAIECVAELGRLFPQADLQDAELGIFRNKILKFDYGDFIEVLHDHRLRNDFNRPKYSQIIGEAEKRHADKHGRPENREGAKNHAEVIRDNWRAKGENVADMSDAEVYLRFHAFQARLAMDERRGPDGELIGRVLSDSAAAKVRRECTRDLMQSGIEQRHAEAFAEAILDTTLERQGFFNLLDDLKNCRYAAAV